MKSTREAAKKWAVNDDPQQYADFADSSVIEELEALLEFQHGPVLRLAISDRITELRKVAEWREQSRTQKGAAMKKGNIIDELCYCGHLRSEHLGIGPLRGHGRCVARHPKLRILECACEKFTWREFVYACRDCETAAKHAYSDATTPGFFEPKCAKHSKRVQP